MNSPAIAAAQTQTYEVLIGRAPNLQRYEYRTNLEGAKQMIARQFPGATCVLRGYTTYQIRRAGLTIGSMQRL